MSMSPDNLCFRIFNSKKGSFIYCNGLSIPVSLTPDDHIEFASNLADKYGKIIYDGDIVDVKHGEFLYRAAVVVDFQNGTWFKSVGEDLMGPFSNQYFGLQEMQLEVVGHLMQYDNEGGAR